MCIFLKQYAQQVNRSAVPFLLAAAILHTHSSHQTSMHLAGAAGCVPLAHELLTVAPQGEIRLTADTVAKAGSDRSVLSCLAAKSDWCDCSIFEIHTAHRIYSLEDSVNRQVEDAFVCCTLHVC